MSKQHGTRDITLSLAHRIHALYGGGMTQQQVAFHLDIGQATVSNILSGKGLTRIRRVADRMEAFIGGVVVGSGNTRFSAAAPGSSNDDGHSLTHAQHTIGAAFENGKVVPEVADPLAELLAEEDILARLAEAGISEDEVLFIDHDADTTSSYQFGGGSPLKRNHAIHLETWDEFMQRAEADGIADRPGAIMKRLENEGMDVDVWSVRDVDFMGWPAGPWSPATTNRSIT